MRLKCLAAQFYCQESKSSKLFKSAMGHFPVNNKQDHDKQLLNESVHQNENKFNLISYVLSITTILFFIIFHFRFHLT